MNTRDLIMNLPDARLLHYEKPSFQWKRTQPLVSTYRPSGLWYTIGSNCLRWCTEDDMIKSPYIYEIILNDVYLLHLANLERLMEFEKYFGIYDNNRCQEIYWDQVGRYFGGIEFTPYIEAKRCASPWYYTIENECGCIWNPMVIKEVNLLYARTGEDEWQAAY